MGGSGEGAKNMIMFLVMYSVLRTVRRYIIKVWGLASPEPGRLHSLDFLRTRILVKRFSVRCTKYEVDIWNGG